MGLTDHSEHCKTTTHPVTLPPSFLAMPRWWHEGHDWLASLPDLVAAACDRWRLDLDGAPMHGSNALVLPVRRDGEPLVLRMTLPDADTAAEIRALRFWNGRGTVRLLDADPATGASLLERLDGAHPLSHEPLEIAMPVMGEVMRRLAIPAPADIPSTGDLVLARLASLEPDWQRLGYPFCRDILHAAREAGEGLVEPLDTLAVNGDLHSEQVLRGERERWLVVDPRLYRGDIDYDLARILWTRLDQMATDREIRHWRDVVIDAAGLEPPRARDWTLFRAIDYWLWGLEYGLTEDPARCARLVGALRS